MTGVNTAPVLVEAVTGAERELGTDPPAASEFARLRPAGFFFVESHMQLSLTHP